jgi:predicted permease
MLTYFTALIPIITLIMLGYALKQKQLLPENTWAGIEKLTYFLLFPALLIHTLGKQELTGIPWPSMLMIIAAILTTSALLLVLFRKIIAKDNATFTSIFQGGVRFNTYITLAVAHSLFGEAGLAIGAIAVGFMSIIANLWCISIFAIWGNKSFNGVIPFTREILFNPLIIACLTGLFLSLSDIGLPYMLGDISEILGRAALPLGLLAVGAALQTKGIKQYLEPVTYSSAVQFALKPLLISFLLMHANLDEITSSVLLIAFIVPTAPSAYILARQLGGNTETMAAIITVQTLLAFLIMPLLGGLLL